MRIVVDGLAYPVVVSSEGPNETARLLERGERAFLVADQAVANRAQEIKQNLLRQGIEICGETTVRGGERYKRWSSISDLHSGFVAAQMDRAGIVVAVGGGTVTDVAGFAAATYMRGIRWLPVATTLSGMVDASIGGKTGVNLPQGKNLAGAFWHPVGVVADVSALATLSRVNLREGVAEMVKTAVIGDA